MGEAAHNANMVVRNISGLEELSLTIPYPFQDVEVKSVREMLRKIKRAYDSAPNAKAPSVTIHCVRHATVSHHRSLPSSQV